MSKFLVDTNVLLDVIGADQHFGECSRLCLEQLAQQGMLIINPVIYAEVGAMCESLVELDELLPLDLFRRDTIPWEAHFLAGQAFRRYRRNKGQQKRVLADFIHATRHPAQVALQADVTKAAQQLPDYYSAFFYEAGEHAIEETFMGLMDLEQVPMADLPTNTGYYLCGPVAFMRAQRHWLQLHGVPAERIHYEVFGPDMFAGLQ